MKRLVFLALCSLFALNAGARTIYVDAKRPNNNGNGLSAKKAKKTLQAAINIAKKGDTIVVYPGTYAPIKTNNKKIAIKSVKGQKRTKIVYMTTTKNVALAELGKSYKIVDTSGRSYSSGIYTKGNKSSLTGFMLDGMNRAIGSFGQLIGLSGGTAKSCTVRRLGRTYVGTSTYNDWSSPAALNCCLTDCSIKKNVASRLVDGCTLLRCAIQKNDGFYTSLYGSKLYNCLVTGNSMGADAFSSTSFINCTIANNNVLFQFSWDDGKVSTGSKFYNCILWNNYSKRKGTEWVEVEKNETETGYYDEYDDWCEGDPGTVTGYYDEYGHWWDEDPAGDGYEDAVGTWIPYEAVTRKAGYYDDNNQWVEYKVETRTFTTTDYEERKIDEPKKLHNADAGNVYKNTDKTNRNPKFANAAKGNYKLKKGSYCINKGKLTKAQKKLVGTKDLAGKKRIRGKAIDRGCYEY